ncbi:Nucleoporin [Globisporangium polare]
MATGAADSAFAFLKQHRQLPTLSTSSSSTFSSERKSTAGAAWGRGARQWSRAPTADGEQLFVGDEMPRELRTLVGASFDVFMRLSRLSDEKRRADRELGASEVVKASRQYREALKTCIFAIEDRVELQQQQNGNTSANADGDDDEEEFVDLLKVSLAIWHLCELLFLQRRPRDDKWIAYDLAQWLQEHFASALMDQLEAASAVLKSSGAHPEQDPAYWSTLHSFVIAGCGDSAWSLLASHSSYKALSTRDVASLTGASTRASFQTIQRLLLNMPGKSRMMRLNDSEEPLAWKQWHDECQYVLNTDSYVKSSPGLSTLLRILVAEEDALVRHASSWYELMMARLFLEEPKRVAHRFEFLMASCFRTYNADTTAMGNFDCIIMAILEYDVQSALQDIHALGFSWMAAHLADLLTKSAAIADDVLEQLDVSLQEYFVLNYAMDIGASSGLWQFAVGYYENCPRLGLVAAKSTLEREAVLTDNKAHRLLAYCQGKRGLATVQRQIALRRAHVCKQKQLYSAALVWMLRGNHLDQVDAICERVLLACEETKSLAPLNEATEFLEAHAEVAQTPLLEWLVRYRELHLVLDDSESLRQELANANEEDQGGERAVKIEVKLRFVLREAAKRIHLLVSSTSTPRQLRSVLLQEAEKLLEAQPTVYSSQYLYSLLAYLHQLDRSFDKASFYALKVNQQLKTRVEMLLARNLSEAILQEASPSNAVAVASAVAAPATASNSVNVNVPLLAASGFGGFIPMEEE